MKVTLIDYTGASAPDPARYAAELLVYTKNTRLSQGEDTRKLVREMHPDTLAQELSYVANTLRSSWEFIDYVFEIQDVTRAFTHQLVRTRTGSYAQQAQRVVDMSRFGVETPMTVAQNPIAKGHWERAMAEISNCYLYLQEQGIPNQDCRGVLPTNVHTNIIAKFNLRTLADLIGKRQNLRAQGEYADVARAMATAVLAVHPWTRSFFYPDRTATPALDKHFRELLGGDSPVQHPEINEMLKELDKVKATWG